MGLSRNRVLGHWAGALLTLSVDAQCSRVLWIVSFHLCVVRVMSARGARDVLTQGVGVGVGVGTPRRWWVRVWVWGPH